MAHLVLAIDGYAATDVAAFAQQWRTSSECSTRVVTVIPAPRFAHAARAEEERIAADRERAESMQAPARAVLGEEATYEALPARSAVAGLRAVLEESGPGSLLVVGSRHTKGQRHTMPGGTVEHLLAGAQATVLIVPWDYVEFAAPIRRVSVIYSMTPGAEAALDEATRLAKELGARLELVGLLAEAAPGTPSSVQASLLEESIHLAAESSGGATGVRLIPTDPAEAQQALGPEDTDLLVCAADDRSPALARFMGGPAASLLRRSRVPLAIVPNPPSAPKPVS